MDFEWDEAKRCSNLTKHGIDFADTDLLFRGEHEIAPAKMVKGEERWLAIGVINGMSAVVVFTLRGETVRIISARRSRHGE